MTVGVHRSRFFCGLLIATVLGSLVAIAFWPQPGVVRLGAGIGILLIAAWAWRCAAKPAMDALRLERDGRIAIRSPGTADFHEVMLLPGSVLHPWLSVIRIRTESGQNFTTWIAADGMAREDFRRLRVFLRWKARFGEGEASE